MHVSMYVLSDASAVYWQHFHDISNHILADYRQTIIDAI